MIVSRETGSGWNLLCNIIRSCDYYKNIFSLKPTQLYDINDGFLFLLFSAKIQNLKDGFVVVADNSSIAERLHIQMIDFFPDLFFYAPANNDNKISPKVFKSEEEKNFSSAYNAVCSDKPSIIITTKEALERPVRPKDEKSDFINLALGEKVKMNKLVSMLEKWGYELFDTASVPKSYSIRGGILDVYPLYAKRPLRIEFFGDTIDSLRLFNPVSQLSVSNIDRFELSPPPDYSKKIFVPFEDILKQRYSNFYYICINDNLINISNSKSRGSVFSVDCLPFQVHSISSLEIPHVFVFASEKTLLKKVAKSLSGFSLINKPLRSGFVSKSIGIAVCGYGDIGAQRPIDINKTVSTPHLITRPGLSDIKWGDFLVHEDYGIGVYRGLSTVGSEKSLQDCINIEYAGGGTVKVPLDRFDKIYKYISGKGTKVLLSTLGKRDWARQKILAKKSIDEFVNDLVLLYSSRRQPRGFEYSSDKELMEMFESSFPFRETPGQMTAIDDVIKDMCKLCPMDRIIFGDVGFGKTEVALRAAMKAVTGNKQVFFLAPTTFLADQHYITAKARLGPFGVNVALISRFQTKSQQLSILRNIENHHLDVIIGTHRLLSSDVCVDNLGLLVIDEEHRFGVKHKEKIRLLKKNVDVLTLTATPIPRTLQQSLAGVRDVSRIDTPPLERLSIHTTVQYFSWETIISQIQRELDRGGQIYFLHNDIQSIPFMVKKIQNRFPGNTVAGAHGSVSSKKLEKIVLSFFKNEIDILVCTTIVESGLDVTNANTIFINNAHRFGLAQLYQIRGRVGRGNIQAYCWLLIPTKKVLGQNAQQRLKAVEHYSALGSGYKIALKDLEIRGAGNIFGYKQSGHVGRVGYDLYCKILKDTVDERLGRNKENIVLRPLVSFHGPAFLPDSYVPLVQDRIFFYQRFSVARSIDDVNKTAAEMIDRFGKPPDESKNIINVAFIRERFSRLAIEKIVIKESVFSAVFQKPDNKNRISIDVLHNLLTNLKKKFRFISNKNGSLSLSINVFSLNESLKTGCLFAELLQESNTT